MKFSQPGRMLIAPAGVAAPRARPCIQGRDAKAGAARRRGATPLIAPRWPAGPGCRDGPRVSRLPEAPPTCPPPGPRLLPGSRHVHEYRRIADQALVVQIGVRKAS